VGALKALLRPAVAAPPLIGHHNAEHVHGGVPASRCAGTMHKSVMVGDEARRPKHIAAYGDKAG